MVSKVSKKTWLQPRMIQRPLRARSARPLLSLLQKRLLLPGLGSCLTPLLSLYCFCALFLSSALEASILLTKQRENRVSFEGMVITSAQVKNDVHQGKEMHMGHWSLLYSRSDRRYMLPLGIKEFCFGFSGAQPRWKQESSLANRNYQSFVAGVGLRMPNMNLFKDNLFLDLRAEIDLDGRGWQDTYLKGHLYLVLPRERLNWTLGAYSAVGRLRYQYAPIVGLDYHIDESWSLSLLVPESLTLTFHESDSPLTLAGLVQRYCEHYRYGGSDQNSGGAWSYRSWQVGLKGSYVTSRHTQFSLFAGQNLLALLKQYNSDGDKLSTQDLDSSPFIEGSFLIKW